MKPTYKFLHYIFICFIASTMFFSCEKPEDDFPDSSEAISFQGIDSTTIKMQAGADLDLDVILVIDTIIDSLKIGYLIDTIGITTNLVYADIETVSIETAFPEDNNKHIYAASIKLPVNAYGIRAFRPYKDGVGDYVRIIFRMEAGSKAYEKQLKVIIEP